MRPGVQPGTKAVSREVGKPTGDEEIRYQGDLDQGYQYQVAKYYEYALIHVYYLMVISHFPESNINLIIKV